MEYSAQNTQYCGHILVVDDHDDMRQLLGRYLAHYGYKVSLAESVKKSRKILAHQNIDLLILDLMMPEEDGLSLCRSLQGSENTPPVIMLTAMGDEADRILGLEMGADDYITKPFSQRELLARIKAVLRRSQRKCSVVNGSEAKQDPKMIRFGHWVFDVSQRHLIDSEGVTVSLSTAEFRLLSAFIKHPNRVLSRDQLLDLTQGREAMPFDRSIDNQISRLRKKIEIDPSNPTCIKTVWGGGYSFVESIEHA